MTNEEARVAYRYHFSLPLMDKLPKQCICGQKVGDGTHLLVCKKVNAGQIMAHDVAVRMIGAELNSYGVVVRYEQRANHDKERERKRTDMDLISTAESWLSTTRCLTHSLPSKEPRGINTTPTKCGMQHRFSRTTSMRTSQGTTTMSLFPWSQSHLEGLGTRPSSSSARLLGPRLHLGNL